MAGDKTIDEILSEQLGDGISVEIIGDDDNQNLSDSDAGGDGEGDDIGIIVEDADGGVGDDGSGDHLEAKGDVESDDDNDDELKDVGEKVRKRIGKLTYRYNEEKRRAEAAEKLREEAIRFAKMKLEENERMRKILEQGENVLVSEIKSRTKADVEMAERAYAAAVEEGDPQKIVETAKILNRAQIEQYQAENYTPTQVQEDPLVKDKEFLEQIQQSTTQPATDPKFEEWKSKNEWFEKEQGMRDYALAIHNKLVESQKTTGIPVGSDEYYSQIDSSMRVAFPAFFRAEGKSEPAASPPPSVVAPGTRNNGSKKPRTVQLTETAKQLAKRLNVPLEVYALEQEKLERRNA